MTGTRFRARRSSRNSKTLRGTLDGLRPEDLYDHDQDHYGGLDANRAIARLAGLETGMRVADFCAGLGGPARFLAREYGVHVTGVELNQARVAGARELTGLVGLEDRVDVIEGNVLAVPLPADAFDAVVSQEAMLHVPDKAAALGEAWRILKPAGRLVFTDWVAHRRSKMKTQRFFGRASRRRRCSRYPDTKP